MVLEVAMIVYEVTAQVDAELCSPYEEYMRDHHIPDLMATGSFESASLESSEPGRYRIRYTAGSREALNDYLKAHAPRLRADFHAHFPTGVELSREEWSVISSFA
jgi:hypothetical protein